MAHSDWDSIAFDEEGKVYDNIVLTYNESCVRLYKNYFLYENSKLWNEDIGYVKPVIAQIYHGNVKLGKFSILLELEENNRTYLYFCICHDKRVMAGICCSGYMSWLEWLQKEHPDKFNTINPMYLNNNNYSMSMSYTTNSPAWHLSFISVNNIEKVYDLALSCPKPSLGDLWTGLTKEILWKFHNWINKINIIPKEYKDKIQEKVKAYDFKV